MVKGKASGERKTNILYMVQKQNTTCGKQCKMQFCGFGKTYFFRGRVDFALQNTLSYTKIIFKVVESGTKW